MGLKKMKCYRGEIWLVDLNPVIGHEQAGKRPALIISDDMYNLSLADMVVVMPITSKGKGMPSHVEIEIEGLPQKSYTKTEDIRAISNRRLFERLGKVGVEVIHEVEEKMKLILGLR